LLGQQALLKLRHPFGLFLQDNNVLDGGLVIVVGMDDKL
jgi:hypothetical protein